MRVLGTFCDLDRDDRFVWLRGFSDMDARRTGLPAFYGGPVWAEHGPLANSTMVDWDDVLLLHTVGDLTLPNARAGTPAASELVITVHDRSLLPDLDPGLGLLETEASANTFTALPVREDADVAVRIGRAAPSTPATQVLRVRPTPRSLLR